VLSCADQERAMPTPSTPRPLQVLTRRQAVVVWAALTSALVVFVALSLLAPNSRPDASLRTPLLLALLLVGIGDVVAGPLVLRSMRRKALASPLGAAALPGQLLIVASALALGVGLFGCVALLVTKDLLFLAFPAAALLVIVRWFPGEARWARLAAPDGSRRNAMIRE
jgi:hypothetical protein